MKEISCDRADENCGRSVAVLRCLFSSSRLSLSCSSERSVPSAASRASVAFAASIWTGGTVGLDLVIVDSVGRERVGRFMLRMF